MIHESYIDGGYYPKGGSYKIAETFLSNVLDKGGEVVCNAKVKKLLLHKETKVCIGVKLEKG